MANMTVLFALMIGTTEAASSEVRPMTSTRLEVEAYIWRTAGTASAGSPRVSTDLQVRSWPRTPPAALIALVAASQATRQVGPKAASGPVNGATSATTSFGRLALAVAPPPTVAPNSAVVRQPPSRAARRARLGALSRRRKWEPICLVPVQH